MMPWLVIYCESRQERQVCWQLRTAGFEYYHATYKRRLHRKAANGSVMVNSSLFPRYVFLMDCPEWQVVRDFRGVIGFLAQDGIPFEIKEDVIEIIRKRQLAGEFDEKPAPKQKARKVKSFRELKNMFAALDSLKAA